MPGRRFWIAALPRGSRSVHRWLQVAVQQLPVVATAPANQADFTCLASVAGLPALALPAGEDADGMPVGVQIIGPVHSETRLFAVAKMLDTYLKGEA